MPGGPPPPCLPTAGSRRLPYAHPCMPARACRRCSGRFVASSPMPFGGSVVGPGGVPCPMGWEGLPAQMPVETQSQARPGPGTGGRGRPTLAQRTGSPHAFWRWLATASVRKEMCSPALVPWGSQPAPEEGARTGNRQTCGRKVQWDGAPVSPASPLGAGIRVITPPPAAHAALSSLSLRGPERQRDPGESCKAAELCLLDGLCPGRAPPAPPAPIGSMSQGRAGCSFSEGGASLGGHRFSDRGLSPLHLPAPVPQA